MSGGRGCAKTRGAELGGNSTRNSNLAITLASFFFWWEDWRLFDPWLDERIFAKWIGKPGEACAAAADWCVYIS